MLVVGMNSSVDAAILPLTYLILSFCYRTRSSAISLRLPLRSPSFGTKQTTVDLLHAISDVRLVSLFLLVLHTERSSLFAADA